MASPRYRTAYNYVYDIDKIGEENKEPSMTVPDQSLSIKDILYRFSTGMPLDDYHRDGIYGDDVENDDDNWDVHPNNQLDHDLSDIDYYNEIIQESNNTSAQNVTTINDDANKADDVTPE